MWIEETKNGKYKFVERYTDPLTGKLKRVSVTYSKNTASTRKQAIKELQEKILIKTKVLDHESLTLEKLCNYYLEAKQLELKESTLEVTRYALSGLLNSLDGNILIDKINALTLREELTNLKPTNIKMLKMVLSWGYAQGYLKEPIHLKILNKKKNTKDKKLYLEKEELKEVLDALKKQARTYNQNVVYHLATFLAYTGLRYGEAAALTKEDLIENTLDINKTFYKGHISTPKTKTSIRKVTINKSAIKAIKEVELLSRINRIDTVLLFPDKNGNNFPDLLFKYTLKKVNKELYPHIFRHTHASLLAERGIPLDVIQRRLGHSNAKTTKDIYIHVTNKKIEEEKELFKTLDILEEL